MGQSEQTRIVYVQKKVMTLGTASTSRNAASETFYEAFPQEDGTTRLVLLDLNDQPTALAQIVEPKELEQEYEHVPDYFENKAGPAEKKVAKKLAQGREHLKNKEYFSAEYEFEGVINMDDRNLEAHVAKGESQIGQGDLKGAKETLDRVSGFDELYDESNKHIFNSYGMTLRKGGFFDKAVESYTKALKMDPGDENLFYNIGRATYEKGDLPKAILFLNKCLELSPDHQDAASLISRIVQEKKG